MTLLDVTLVSLRPETFKVNTDKERKGEKLEIAKEGIYTSSDLILFDWYFLWYMKATKAPT